MESACRARPCIEIGLDCLYQQHGLCGPARKLKRSAKERVKQMGEENVDVMALAASLPLNCPCNSSNTCRGGCDYCEKWGVKTQTIVNAAYAKGYQDALARGEEQ